MRYWWTVFITLFIGFISLTNSLFFSYKMEGRFPGSLNELLLYLWWVIVIILLVLLFLKWKDEKK